MSAWTDIRGFRFSALAAGIKKKGGPDLALAVCDGPAAAAGLFTRNLVRAAPVEVAARRVRSGRARAILVNSGCANACTGAAGLEATLTSTAAVASALGIVADDVLPASTGVIGALLPAERIVASAPALVAGLSPDGHAAFADAIRTTDRFAKIARASAGPADAAVHVLGMAKGAGMIHPDVGPPQATMLAFLFTDALVSAGELAAALEAAVDRTLNVCSVDGDTSTNDSVLALASGASGNPVASKDLEAAFTEICDVLARAMVADGEGAEHAVEIRVCGLASDADARQVARTVATSMLVKTALFGKDANWGRLLAAAGRAGVAFDPLRASIVIAGVPIVEGGATLGADAEARASAAMRAPSYAIDLRLGTGPGSARYLMSDLGHGYVDVNAGYRS